jgi:hypothetical protein
VGEVGPRRIFWELLHDPAGFVFHG